MYYRPISRSHMRGPRKISVITAAGALRVRSDLCDEGSGLWLAMRSFAPLRMTHHTRETKLSSYRAEGLIRVDGVSSGWLPNDLTTYYRFTMLLAAVQRFLDHARQRRVDLNRTRARLVAGRRRASFSQAKPMTKSSA